MVPDVRINQDQAEIQPDYSQSSLKGLTGGKSGWFSHFPFIWSFTIPFKNLEVCWEEHPVSSYLLPSSRWNKSDTIFSDWVCLSGWPLLYFYSTTGFWKISVYMKRTSTNVCIVVLIYQPGQWFRFSLIPYLVMATSSEVPALSVASSFAKLYLLSWYCEDLSISDLWLTLCLYTILYKEA